jgi:hypothetical protein
MKVITWAPGTNNVLDNLFDKLREQQYQDRSHRLWKNYSSDFLKYSIALTICFDNDNNPEMCSSIASRECWPCNSYRILNRLWKHSNKISYPRVMSESFGKSAQSQIDWLKNNTDYQMYFISRQTNNWEDWCIRNFRDGFNILFDTDTYKYLTCNNESDESCWQKIIYNGSPEILESWKRRI